MKPAILERRDAMFADTIDLLEGFERAWQETPPAELDDYLPARGNPRRWSALVDLIHIDLEFRLKARQDARVESYLERYQDLRGDGRAVLPLIAGTPAP